MGWTPDKTGSSCSDRVTSPRFAPQRHQRPRRSRCRRLLVGHLHARATSGHAAARFQPKLAVSRAPRQLLQRDAPQPVHTEPELPHNRSTRVGQPTDVPPSCCGVATETTTRCCGFGLDSPMGAYYSLRLRKHGAQQGAGPPEGPRPRPTDRPSVSPFFGRSTQRDSSQSWLDPPPPPSPPPTATATATEPTATPPRPRKRERFQDEAEQRLRPADRGPEADLEGLDDRATVHAPRHPPV